MKMFSLFFLFLLAPKGRLRIKRWRAFRSLCLVRAYEGQKKKD
jgi:hypothetical protein